MIDGFAGRRSAIPFALLILGVLAIGLVGLLMLNTAMDGNSVKMEQAQQQQAALTDREQQLSQQLAGLSAPSSLASEAAALGLVPNPQPAFINPTTGAVLGTPSPAPTPSPTPTPTPTSTPTPSGSASATASGTATASAGASPSSTGSSTVPNTASVAASAAVATAHTASAAPNASAQAGTSARPSPSGSQR